jgi:hypothetical protein
VGCGLDVGASSTRASMGGYAWYWMCAWAETTVVCGVGPSPCSGVDVRRRALHMQVGDCRDDLPREAENVALGERRAVVQCLESREEVSTVSKLGDQQDLLLHTAREVKPSKPSQVEPSQVKQTSVASRTA